MDKIKIIAYYLPQFHPFPENDEWWGKGFTEWTNVGKAKPLFKGHNQPRVPADLGYYDLRLPIVREQQVELAREAGVDGFCYWHYWFGGKGRQLMNNIIDEVLESGTPNFPFCLGWANETWKEKQWNKDGSGDKILMEQKYLGEEDYRLHYEYVRNLFKDNRYIRIDGKPFFLIYKPYQFPDVSVFIQLWNKWIKEDNIADGVYFVANLDDESLLDDCISIGFNAVVPAHLVRLLGSYHYRPIWYKAYKRLLQNIFKRPFSSTMKEVNCFIYKQGTDEREDVIPYLLPQWDHTPRSGYKGYYIEGCNPDLFYEQAVSVLSNVSKKNNKLVLLKSWNEWAEGNYMEPDLKYGKGYINALKRAIDKTSYNL